MLQHYWKLVGCSILRNGMVMDHPILSPNLTRLFYLRNKTGWSITISLTSIRNSVIPKKRGVLIMDHLTTHYFCLWFDGKQVCIYCWKCNLAGSKMLFRSCFVWACNWGWFYTSPPFRQDIWIIYGNLPSFLSMYWPFVCQVSYGCFKFCRATKTS